MLKYENQAQREGFRIIVGIDEAGRGPLAGPVVAAAVFLSSYEFKARICDSKKLSALRREEAFHEILEKSYVGVGVMNELIIDDINILQATHKAMSAAVYQLMYKLPPAVKESNFEQKVCLLIDGNSFKSDTTFAHKTIIGGDNLSLSIAAASIVAKVTRDRILKVYDQIFPDYGFAAHKGYGTRTHRLAIQKHGPSAIHRRSFLSNVLSENL